VASLFKAPFVMKKIVPVQSKKELGLFIDFPHELYKNDPNYVPELFIAQKDLLTTHPFHKHSSLQTFLAYDGDKIVGRIAAIYNTNHNSFNNVNEGFFGFFDCINDQETANLLFETSIKWLKEKGATKIAGPVNPSTNETSGLLVKGFDRPPIVMMTYNPEYYITLLENFGFKKQTDLFAWFWEGGNYNDKSMQMLDKLQERLKRNSNVVIRKINMKNFKKEADALRDVYNKAWDKNLGFFPMTNEEFDYTAKDLKLILDPDFAYLAEQDGKIVGFGVAIPDINPILKTIKKGRLLPTGIFKLLLNKGKAQGIRIMLLGVIDGYRKMGIEACLYGSIIKEYRRKGLKYAEAGWTLENNEMVNRAIEAIGGDQYKTYRIYEKGI
jgi:GNAT superfamily N-acetyltransferase